MKKHFLLFTALVLMASCGKASSSLATPSVSIVHGEVQINGNSVNPGDTLKNGDRITTGADSGCDVVFSHNIIEILDNSDVVLNLNDLAKSLKISQGQLNYALGDLKKEAKSFRVETQTAAAAVRGTAFTIKVLSPTNTYICACNGDVSVQDKDGNQSQEIVSAHHKAVRLIKTSDGKIIITNAEMKYHTDEGMEKLARRIHYKIDWTKTNGLEPLNK